MIWGDAKEIEREYIYFEHEGNAALRIGNWKILYVKTGEPKGHVPAPQSVGTSGWSFYDLSKDRCEQNDLAEKHPERLADMVVRWKELHKSFREQAER